MKDKDNSHWKEIFKWLIKISLLLLLIVAFSNLIKKDGALEIKKDNEVSVESSKFKYGVNKGDLISNYEFEDISTGEKTSMEDYKGKKVLLFFWATWCPYCNDTMPELEELDDDIVVIGANSHVDEISKNDVKKFLKKKKLDYKNVFVSEKMIEDFYLQSFPTSIFINSEGVIEEGVMGGLTKEMIEERFKSID